MTQISPSVSTASDQVDLATVQFRSFYAELQKVLVSAAQTPELEAELQARTLSQHLCQFIELQTLEAKRIGGMTAVVTDAKARFLKAALADELMIKLDWVGRTAWRSTLMEAALFQSSSAGDKVFEDIETFLEARDPSQVDIAKLYLYTLSLDFQGRLRDSESSESSELLVQYKSDLFLAAYQQAANLSKSDKVLNPQAYSNTLTFLKPRRVPRFSRSTVILVSLAVALYAVSMGLWLWKTQPLRQSLEKETVSLAAPLADSASRWSQC